MQSPFNQNHCPCWLVIVKKVMAVITRKDEVDEVMQHWMPRPFGAKNDVVSFKRPVNTFASLAKQVAMLLVDLRLEEFFVFLKFSNTLFALLT